MSYSIVEDTINWLNQQEASPLSKSDLVSEKHDRVISLRDTELDDGCRNLHKNHYLSKYEDFMKELDDVYSEFINGNTEGIKEVETLRYMPLFRTH